MKFSRKEANSGGDACVIATHSNRANLSSFTSRLILIPFLIACLSITGCIGITSASKLNASSSVPDSHFVTLTWVPSASDVAAYNVYRSESAAGPFLRLATVAAAEREYVDKSVEADETYYYVLTSVSPEGMESSDSTLAIAPVP